MERQGPGHGGNLVGALLDGRYRVDLVLARGGMSTVYQGTDTRLERPVAIKVMDPRYAADPVFLQRFEREARAVARLRHPGIVGIYDQGVDCTDSDPTASPGGRHVFLIMELVDGATLRDLLREHGRLPVPLALSVIDLVLSALAVAHREGLVHRDVKPENVLIGAGGVVKVADFGLVRAVAEAGSNTGDVILGTVAYLSPEQVATGAADPRSDVYAAGVLLFEMLTGTPPYTGETALSVAYRHVNDDVPAPSTVGPPLPVLLDDLVVRATRRDPAARPADAAAFRLALRQVCTDLGIDPVPVPLPSNAAAQTSPPVTSQPVTSHPAMQVPVTEAHGSNGRVPAADAHAALAALAGDHGPRGTRALARSAAPAGGPGQRHHHPSGHQPASRHPSRPPNDDPYQRQRSRDRRTFMTWTVVVLLLASMLGVASWWLGSGRWTEVPDVTGLQRTAVQDALASADLAADIAGDHHDTIPDGTVISIDPGAGNRALRGSEVTVLFSLGHPVVPDLPVGIPAEEAERTLREADLSPQRAPAAAEFHDTVPLGTVLGMQPAAGTVLTVGAPVRLVISKGPAPTTVPEVRGLPEADAIAALAQAGLTAAVRREFDDELAAGRTIGTVPQAGDQTSRGTGVSLLVSTALVVPEVVGQLREPALAALTSAGFKPQERGDGAGQPGATVVSVQPGVGSLVDPSGNRVTVQLSSRVVVPDVVGLPVARARQVLGDAGLSSEVRRFFGGGSSPVLAQSPDGGQVVRPGATVSLRTF